MTPFEALTLSSVRSWSRGPAPLGLVLLLVSLIVLALGPVGGARLLPVAVGWSTALVSALGGALDCARLRGSGLGSVLEGAPTGPWPLLGAATTGAVLASLVPAAGAVVVAAVPVAGVGPSSWGVPGVLGLLPPVLGSCLFYALGVLVGLGARSTSAAAAAALVLVVAQAAMVAWADPALGPAPGWVDGVARFLPLSVLVDSLRWPLTGTSTVGMAARCCLVLAGGGAVLLGAVARLMRRGW